jgi:2-iminobutanoate/2-iminopropanoate deaminase
MRSRRTSGGFEKSGLKFQPTQEDGFPMKEAFKSDNAPKPLAPYSQVVKAGQFLFLAGQIPLDAEGRMLEGDISRQAHQVLENLKAVLQSAGAGMENVVKTTIFLASIDDFDAVNRVYAGYFTPPYPARSTVEVGRLPRGAAIEMDAIAFVQR